MADSFGIFIDAGYLFAASGELCLGTTNRDKIVINFRTLVEALVDHAEQMCGLRPLRMYWYDGARDAQPTAQHLDVANLPGVKLRLGRLVRGRQKGVDSRIVRDLIILSQERAISYAFLLGGDEDLREGVAEAQERGVRVILMAIEPLNQQNLSPTLAMEADDVLVLNQDFMKPHVSMREEPSATGQVADASVVEPEQAGRQFGVDLIAKLSNDQLHELRRNRPRIPSELDRALLESAGAALGHRHLEDDERSAIRRGFWQAVLSDVGSGSTA